MYFCHDDLNITRLGLELTISKELESQSFTQQDMLVAEVNLSAISMLRQ